MNRDALRELFDYTTLTWASHGDCVRSSPDSAFTRAVDYLVFAFSCVGEP